MRASLAAARSWSPSVRAGVFFGVGMSICLVFVPEWPEGWVGRVVIGVIVGAFVGVLFGFFMGRYLELQTVAAPAALDELSATERRAAIHAAARGPVPADPVVRRAALLVAEHSRDSTNSMWRFILAGCLSTLGLYVFLALTASSWWWIAVIVFASWLVQHVSSRRRVDRRIAVLESTFDGQ